MHWCRLVFANIHLQRACSHTKHHGRNVCTRRISVVRCDDANFDGHDYADDHHYRYDERDDEHYPNYE